MSLLNFKLYSVHSKIGSKLGGKLLMAKKNSKINSIRPNSNRNKKCAYW